MKNILKIMSLFVAVVALYACEKEAKNTELTLIADKDVIQANGQDAVTFRVMYGDRDVTSEASICDENHNVVEFAGGQFTTTKVGEYRFYADYGTGSTYNKASEDFGFLVIKAIDVPVPDRAVDDEVGNTAFVHRTFLTQYTGTECPNCPYMVKHIRELLAEGIIPDKAVLAAVHTYNSSDPAYVNFSPRAKSYPYLTLDLVQGYNHVSGLAVLKELVAEYSAGSAKAGISVNPVLYDDKAQIVVKVAVKAAVDGEFRVGAWLMEDDIYGQQSGAPDKSFNYHENCVRIADSMHKDAWFGYDLGNMSKGEVAEKTFVMNLEENWKTENLHLAVFASYGVQDGSRTTYAVCNAVDAPIDAPTPFEYAK